jgi:hypothetical protein
VLQLLVTANVVPSSPTSVILIMETIRDSETSVLTTATRRNIPDDGILHCHRRENLKSYRALTGWVLKQGHILSPVSYELGFYISEDGIPHSHIRKNIKCYIF